MAAIKFKKAFPINLLWFVCIFASPCLAAGQNTNESDSIAPDGKKGIVLVSSGQEVSTVRIEPAKMDSNNVVAVIFEGTDDLHYYAKSETAPAEGLELKIQATSEDFEFGEVIFPKWHFFTDPLNNKIEVYEGNFIVAIPITDFKNPTKIVSSGGNLEIKISGIACTSKICLPPFEKTIQTKIDFSQRESWQTISFEEEGEKVADETEKVIDDPEKIIDGPEKVTDEPEKITAPSYSIPFALGLALLAGLSLNIMPCVWPVLPLIVMRIVEQAKAGEKQSRAMGIAFCSGILLFFAALAIANIVLQLFYGTWDLPFVQEYYYFLQLLLLRILSFKSSTGRYCSGAISIETQSL
jgi:thiol:disulfide interchange protein